MNLNKSILPHDVLLLVLGNLDQDQATLYHCSLVNKEFNSAASKALYTRVLISPPFQAVLDLKATRRSVVSLHVSSEIL
jgi:F-box-like